MMFQFLSKQPLQLNAVDWLRAKVLANHRSPLDSWIKGLFVKFISILYNCSSKIPNLETALNDTSELSLIPKINCKLKRIIERSGPEGTCGIKKIEDNITVRLL